LEIGGGGTLACLLLFGIPARRRSWPMLLGMLAVLFALTSGIVGCGGSGGSTSQPTGNSGTTPGNYTITVTATGSAKTGGTVTATLPVTVTVQ
jgi:PKD repeat protein